MRSLRTKLDHHLEAVSTGCPCPCIQGERGCYRQSQRKSRHMVQLNEVCLDDRLTHLALVGKLDIAGLHTVDVKFHGYTAARRRPTLVDVSGLEFITSLGIGMLISCARSLQRYGAKMVLLNPQPQVEEILKAVGIDQGIPIVRSAEEGARILFPVS